MFWTGACRISSLPRETKESYMYVIALLILLQSSLRLKRISKALLSELNKIKIFLEFDNHMYNLSIFYSVTKFNWQCLIRDCSKFVKSI